MRSFGKDATVAHTILAAKGGIALISHPIRYSLFAIRVIQGFRNG
jgi:hypothetical protein